MMERCFDAKSPIDFSRIKAIIGNLENIVEFVKNFMESLVIDKHFLENAYHLGDWELIKELVHRIRGSAVYLGAVFVETTCRELEYSLLGLNHKNREELYHKAISAIIVLENYIDDYLSSSVD